MRRKDYRNVEPDNDEYPRIPLTRKENSETIKIVSLPSPSYVGSGRLISFCLLFLSAWTIGITILLIIELRQSAGHSLTV